jgi:hypothetical protein
MTIDRQRYLGWRLGSIALENRIFTINLARHSLTRDEWRDLARQRVQAKIVFASVERIVLSRVCGGGEVTDIICSNDGAGNIFCELKLSPDSSIGVTAGEMADFMF